MRWVALLAGLAVAGPAFAQGTAETQVPAGHGEITIPKTNWSFNGPFGTFDRASAQRGFQVYKEVCANCHGMKLLSYRDLTGIGLNEAQVESHRRLLRSAHDRRHRSADNPARPPFRPVPLAIPK